MSNLPPVHGGRLHALRAAALRWLLRQESSQDQASLRLHFMAWLGCLTMPLYYAVWAWWFPQEYESLPLRAAGFAICVCGLVLPRLVRRSWLRVYEFAGVTYVLPFFFCFMFLMNHASAVWAQSLLVALVVLFQFDWWWAVASCVCGCLLAAGAFALAGDAAFLASPQVAEQVPLTVFTVAIVSIAKVGRKVLAREKMAGMAQALAMVSHELRTPLLSVAANVRGIERALGGRATAGAGNPRDGAADAVERIRFEVVHMNKMIDLFLRSATAMNDRHAATEQVSMARVVAAVIDRYPFASGEERRQVDVVVRHDFVFAGRHELCVVLLLNLLRNALKALARAGNGGGRVRIVVDGAGSRRRLLVLDTGCGIPARNLPHIFERFVSYPAGSGSGIGLALCKDIVHGWQGRIRCRSRESAYTAFTLEFPDRFSTSPP